MLCPFWLITLTISCFTAIPSSATDFQSALDEVYQAQSLGSLVYSIKYCELLLSDPSTQIDISAFYALVFQRANIICSSDSAMNIKTRTTSTSLIRLICIMLNQIRSFHHQTYSVNEAWDRFTSIYFRYFADKYKAYFFYMHKSNVSATIQTFHAIATGLKDNIQHLEDDHLDEIISAVIKMKNHHQIASDHTFYVKLMEIFAKRGNFYSATTVMMHLQNHHRLNHTSFPITHYYQKSFFKANGTDFEHVVKQLADSPQILLYVVGVIMPFYAIQSTSEMYSMIKGMTHSHSSDSNVWMCFHVMDRDFKSAVELFLDYGGIVADMSDAFWVTYLYMVRSVSNVSDLHHILCSFKELRYSASDDARNNQLDLIIFFTFTSVTQHQTEIIDAVDINTYQMLFELCEKSSAFNNRFLLQLFRGEQTVSTYFMLKRLMAVHMGKQTQGYQNYISAVKKENRDSRNPSIYPVTPDAKAIRSAKNWRKIKLAWRQNLKNNNAHNSTTCIDYSAFEQ